MAKRKNSEPENKNDSKRHYVRPYSRWVHNGPPIREFRNISKGWIAEVRDIHEE
jgi:hypothetical protein